MGEALKELCMDFISRLDERGYIELGDPLSLGEKDALRLLQSLDPAGVGARSLQECLLIQLEREGLDSKLTARIVAHHLDEVAHGQYGRIAQALNATTGDVKKSISAISSLSPIPSRGYRTNQEPQLIEPEALVEEGEDGNLAVRMRGGPVYLNASYTQELGHVDQKTQAYIDKARAAAHELIDMMTLRSNTLEQILCLVVDVQHDALVRGSIHLKPLTMKEVSDQLGLSASTVSRAVQGKWVLAPCGLIRLRDCFSTDIVPTRQPAINGEENVRYSNKSIMERVIGLIRNEKRDAPLSDQMIMQKLRSQGISISRRAIAKYRSELGIPSSRGRALHS